MKKARVAGAAIWCRIATTSLALAALLAVPGQAADPEKTAQRAGKFVEKTATKAGKFVGKTATKAGKFVERTATKTGNAVKRATD